MSFSATSRSVRVSFSGLPSSSSESESEASSEELVECEGEAEREESVWLCTW